MNGAPLLGSLDRIEAALDKIETAAREAKARAAEHASQQAGNADLLERHDALKSEVAATLARIDILIDGQSS